MDKFNTHQVTMGIKKSIKQQNSKQKRHIAPKSKEFRSWILQKVIDNGKNNSLNIWILDDRNIWGTHLNRHEVVMGLTWEGIIYYTTSRQCNTWFNLMCYQNVPICMPGVGGKSPGKKKIANARGAMVTGQIEPCIINSLQLSNKKEYS